MTWFQTSLRELCLFFCYSAKFSKGALPAIIREAGLSQEEFEKLRHL